MGKPGRQGHRYRKLRERIKRRDRVCWICGEPIDMALKYPHPMSWSLDHVEPVALRPELALDPTNARGAHLRHNSARGTGGGAKDRAAQSRAW